MVVGSSAQRRVLGAALALALCGCPNQELAPLVPCTVSVASIDATQNGTDQVDLLFVIDNSASMSEEQIKLNAQLPRLVQVLTSGDSNGDGQQDFKPVGSLRLGVVSTDMGSNGVTGVRSCGSNSFLAAEQNITVQGVDNQNRPFGDDGLLLNSTAVAVAGVSVPNALQTMVTQAVAPRPECALNLPRVLEFPGGGNANEIAARFSCMAQLGVNGCTIEQQLESMWKALAPSTDRSFSRGTGGQGLPMGLNAGFLRPEAILAVIVVSDEDDCSSPDAAAQTLYASMDVPAINIQCGRNPNLLHQAQRYVMGLKSLKAEQFQDRIIFGGIVGVPLASATRGQSLEQILARPDMQFVEQNVFVPTPRPVCSARGNAGTAAPARRIVQVAQGFGENGVITSICEDDYAGALDAVIGKIAGKLSGECLPRSLVRGPNGTVACRVVEVKASGDVSPCDPARGRSLELPSRKLNGTLRRVCEIQQLAVQNRQAPNGVGWYYDDFSGEVNRCESNNRQRIAFTPTAGIDNGGSARFECFRTAPPEPTFADARGVDAVNTNCADNGTAAASRLVPASGNAKCHALRDDDYDLVCVAGTCQVSCTRDLDCQPAHVCTSTDGTPGYCANPTCPAGT